MQNEADILATGTPEKPTILVVEDDNDMRQYISSGLMIDYEVVEAVNGKDGLTKAIESVPDLIITDVMMPEMDGVAMCAELRAKLETSHIPIVMLTAKASVENQMQGLKTGADDYVTKPFHMQLLQVRIANLLESRRMLREKFRGDTPLLTPAFSGQGPEKEFLDKAMSVLEEHYSEWEFKTDDFAAGMHMSRRTLLRKLKAVADRTPSEFILEYRMMKAAELLVNTSATIAEIAFQVGCDQATNFSRLFKKCHNSTPSEYRSENQSSSS
jgi:DNA-binding response OmpR family regulator